MSQHLAQLDSVLFLYLMQPSEQTVLLTTRKKAVTISNPLALKFTLRSTLLCKRAFLPILWAQEDKKLKLSLIVSTVS